MKESTKEKENAGVSFSQWQTWVLDAVNKIRGQKQRPSLERIVNAIRQHHRYSAGDIETQVERCVESGAVLKVFNKGQNTYMNPGGTANRKLVINADTDLTKILVKVVSQLDEEGSSFKNVDRYIHHAYSIERKNEECDLTSLLKSTLNKAVDKGLLVLDGKLYRLPVSPDSTTNLIGTPISKYSSGRKSRLLKSNTNESETSNSVRRFGRKSRRLTICDTSSLTDNEASDKELNKTPGQNVCAECLGTSARNQCGEAEALKQCRGGCGVSLHPSCLASKDSGPLTTLLARGSRWFCQDCRACSAIPSCSITEQIFLLNCDTCDRGYHMQCLQPAAEDKPKSAWRCSFCLDRHETVNISIEEEPCVERRGRKKSSLNIQRTSRGRSQHQEHRLGTSFTSSSMQQRDVTEDGNVSSPDSSAPPSPVPISGSMRRDTAISKEKAKFFRQSAAFNARGVNGRGSGVPKVNNPANKRLSSSSSDSSSSSSSSSSSRSRSSSSSSTSSSSSDSSNNSSSSSSSSAHACSLSVRPSRPVFPLPKCLAARNADFNKSPSKMSYKSCSSTSQSVQSSKKNEHYLKMSEKIKYPSESKKMNKTNDDQSKTTPKVLLRAPKLIAKVNSSQPKIFPLSNSKLDSSDSPISLFKKLLTDVSNEPWGFAALAAKAPIIEDLKPEAINNKKDKPIAGFIQLKGLFDGLSHFYSTPLQSRTRPRTEKDSKPSIQADTKVTSVDKKLKMHDKQESPSFLVKSAVSSKLMETRDVTGSGGEQKLDHDVNKSLANSPSAFRDSLSVPTIRPVTRSVLENMSRLVASDLPSGVLHEDVEIYKETRKRAINSTSQASEFSIPSNHPVRCPAAIQFGKYEVETWFSSPFPQEYARLPKLFLCEFCLKYTKSKSVLERHMHNCNWRHPPATEIYRRDDLSVFEVDGNANKIYCQTLCLLAKLFLDHKTLYYDVEPFLFYVLTKNDSYGCHLVGYFSKEKHCQQKYNVSCILTMPQYQRQGFGRFLIEFSYLLSKIEGQPGTPEKPLSDLGQVSYHAYWKAVILEYFDQFRDSPTISVSDISSKTGLMRHDITFTLQSLNMIVEDGEKLLICIDWNIVDAHIKRKKSSKHIPIEPECLRWTPLMPASNILISPDGRDNQDLEEPHPIKIEIIKSPIKKRRCSRRMPMIKRRRKMDKNRRCLFGALKKSKLVQSVDDTINPEQTLPPLKIHKNERTTDIKKETTNLNDSAKESEVKCLFKLQEEKLKESSAKNENSKEIASKPSTKTKQSLISNFLKRESSDTNTEVVVVPHKKKRKLTRGRSRKRQRPKTQRDNSGPKVKKARKIEQLPKSPEVETFDENKNKDLQSEEIENNDNPNDDELYDEKVREKKDCNESDEEEYPINNDGSPVKITEENDKDKQIDDEKDKNTKPINEEDKITKFDEKEDKITKFDEKEDKVTKCDDEDKVTKCDDEDKVTKCDEEDKVTKLDNEDEETKFDEEDKVTELDDEDKEMKFDEEKKEDSNNTTDKLNTSNEVSIEKLEIHLSKNSDLEVDTTAVQNHCSEIVDSDVNEKSVNSKEDCKVSSTGSSISNNDNLICPNEGKVNLVDSCNDVPLKNPCDTEKESSNNNANIAHNLEKSHKSIADDLRFQPKVQLCNNVLLLEPTPNPGLQTILDRLNSGQTESKQYNEEVLSSKLKENAVETDIHSFNNPAVCGDFSKTDTAVQPVTSINEKQYNTSTITNEFCKASPDPALLPNVKQYGSELSTGYCKTDTVVQQNAKQYNDSLMSEYRKLDMLQPEINKQIYNKEEYNKNSQSLPVSTQSSQEMFKVVEQAKPKVSEKNYSHSAVAENTITVPKYDGIKHEKPSKRTTPSPKTLPYRLPTEVPQVEKSRLHDYLPPMGFVNYQKINNSVAKVHSDIPKASKDLYLEKKTDSANMNLPKDKDVMNLPKSMDNSLLYSSVMQQSPYTDQSMMHLSLHHHLAHSSQYHHSPPIPSQVPPPVHQAKSRSKKSEQRRLAQQNQTPVAPSTQQPTPPSLPSHTQSYHHHHHHQTATYMMPQPSPSSPYHHSVIQHRMGQQGGSCLSADFYLSHSNQHAAAAAAQIASCNLSKLQQMTNGIEHHRRHISSPSSSPASSPANMTPPPPAASAAATHHLLQQSAVAYQKLYQQAGQPNQSRQYGHQSRSSSATPNVGLMSMQYGATPPTFNGYRVAPQSTPPPSAASYMNQATGQLQYATHSQDPHHQNSVYPASAYNGSYLQPLNGSMHR